MVILPYVRAEYVDQNCGVNVTFEEQPSILIVSILLSQVVGEWKEVLVAYLDVSNALAYSPYGFVCYILYINICLTKSSATFFV